MLPHVSRPKGIMLAGPCIVGGDYTVARLTKTGADTTAIFTDNVAESDIYLFAFDALVSRENDDITGFIKDHATVKGPFRSLLFESIISGQFNDEIVLLQQSKLPILVLFGQDEKIVNPDYLDEKPIKIWNDTIFKLPKAGHLVQIDQPQAFNQLLANYASDRFRLAPL